MEQTEQTVRKHTTTLVIATRPGLDLQEGTHIRDDVKLMQLVHVPWHHQVTSGHKLVTWPAEMK